ncbi:MAG: carbohydrate ABC transporter permease [Gorillibacterium sp.]|nr:carbohydrate ABC transporter permease [Gorillibacterium sp.]
MRNTISKPTNLILHLLFIIISIISLYPLLLVLGISITDEKVLNDKGYHWFPSKLGFEAYQYVIDMGAGVTRAYGVTIFVTVLGTLLSLLVISMFAYALSRPDVKYRNFFAFFIFITMIFSGGLVSWYLICTQFLHLRDTIWALILPGVMSGFNVIVLRTFFTTSIPMEILDSAKMDGSGELRTFAQIVLPLSLPGLATIAIFTSVSYWNDYFTPLMLIREPGLYNLQYLIFKVMSNIDALRQSAEFVSDIRSSGQLPPEQGARMALAVFTIGPIIFVYPFLQKYFIKGLTIGAIKG